MTVEQVGSVSEDTNSNSNTTSLSFNHTITADTDCLIIFIGLWKDGGTTVSSVTYDGSINATAGPAVTNADGDTSAIYYIKKADLPSPGTYSIAVTSNAACEHQHSAANYKNVDQAAIFSDTASNNDSSNNPTADVTSAVGELVVATASWYISAPTFGAEDTEINHIDNGSASDSQAAWSNVGAAGTVTIDIDIAASRTWTIAAGSLKEAVTGGAELEGNLAGAALFNANLSTQLKLLGQLSGDSALNSSLSTALNLLGTVSGSGDLSAQLLTQLLLAAGIKGSSLSSAALSSAIVMSGSLSGHSDTTGQIATQVLLNASALGRASLSGDLQAQIVLLGNTKGSSLANGALQTGEVYAGNLTGTSLVTGELLTNIKLGANTGGDALLAGSIDTAVLLNALVDGDSQVVGTLTIDSNTLASALAGDSQALATLTAQIQLSGVVGGSGLITGLLVSGGFADIVGVISIESRTPVISAVSKSSKITIH